MAICRYQGRTIWYKEQKLEERRVVIFFDEEHRIEEDRDYLDRVDSGKYDNYTLRAITPRQKSLELLH